MKRHFGSGVRWAVLALVIAALLLPMAQPRQAMATEGGGPGNPGDPLPGTEFPRETIPAHLIERPPEGAVKIDAGGGIESIAYSFVGFDRAGWTGAAPCWTPNGGAQTFCFAVRTYSDNGEDQQYTLFGFPAGWSVTAASFTNGSCTNGGTLAATAGWNTNGTNYDVFFSHVRTQNAGDVCTAWYCWTVTPPSSGSSDALVSWQVGAPTSQSECCSCNAYNPNPYWGCDFYTGSQARIPLCTTSGTSNVDGEWLQIDVNDATCDNYATGWNTAPGNDGYQYFHQWWNDQSYWSGTNCAAPNHTGLTTDWNQVRYGVGVGYTSCSTTDEFFNAQSGFAFNGTNDIGTAMQGTSPFVVGKFCHINNPLLTAYTTNFIDWVPLDLTVTNMKCPGGGAAIPSTVSYYYEFALDETPNQPECGTDGCDCDNTNDTYDSDFCPYGPGDPFFQPGDSRCPYWPGDTGPNRNGCADDVAISLEGEKTYTCSGTTYTLAGLGFIEEAAPYNGCSTYNASYVSAEYISDEGATNCACLWARVIVPLSVDLKRFEAWPEGATIHVQWETNQEIDNLGFNLYRSNTRDGLRVKLNRQLIPTLVPPGSPFGAVYDWIDAYRLRPGRTYFYWLEDVDIYGSTTMHDPVRVRLR